MSAAPVVSIEGLHVEATTDSGRRIPIVRNVSLEVGPGEIVALIGESGSGKTTVALSLLGHTRPGCRIAAGRITVAGQEVTALGPRGLTRLRGCDVAYVPQSAAAAFNPSMRIMDQVIETTRIHGLMPAREARAKAVALFRALSLPEPETIGGRYPHQVSGGQLQRLAAAMALIAGPKLVVFDEPTTALDVTTQIEVLRAFKSAMDGGQTAGVYVSHDLAVVAQIADRIVVLRGGEVQETGTTVEILHAPQHPYTQELLAAFEPKPRAIREQRAVAATPLLELVGVTAGYGPLRADGMPTVPAVRDVSLRLEEGRNLGIIGESGCGKSSLARTIAGIMRPARGEIRFDGQALGGGIKDRPREALRAVQIVFQHADTALNRATPIEEILSRPMRFYAGLDRRGCSARVDGLLDMVRLPRSVRGRYPGELSGGQKQRVNLARALAAEPRLILCDEITSALDTVVAAAIVELLQELQRELKLSYVFISHDLSVVRAICDEVVVMLNGRTVEHLLAADIDRAQDPYSRLLFSSVPKLDPGWLDGLDAAANAAARPAQASSS